MWELIQHSLYSWLYLAHHTQIDAVLRHGVQPGCFMHLLCGYLTVTHHIAAVSPCPCV